MRQVHLRLAFYWQQYLRWCCCSLLLLCFRFQWIACVMRYVVRFLASRIAYLKVSPYQSAERRWYGCYCDCTQQNTTHNTIKRNTVDNVWVKSSTAWTIFACQFKKKTSDEFMRWLSLFVSSPISHFRLTLFDQFIHVLNEQCGLFLSSAKHLFYICHVCRQSFPFRSLFYGLHTWKPVNRQQQNVSSKLEFIFIFPKTINACKMCWRLRH